MYYDAELINKTPVVQHHYIRYQSVMFNKHSNSVYLFSLTVFIIVFVLGLYIKNTLIPPHFVNSISNIIKNS